MGCTPSKPPVCQSCHAPIKRSQSMQTHHAQPRDGDTYHVVALTSSTLGSLQFDPSKSYDLRQDHPAVVQIRTEPIRQYAPEKTSKDFAVGVIEAKTWSKKIDEKIPKVIPKTPITTPPGEPETINVWELMAGLDDTIPLRPPTNHVRSFSFSVNWNSVPSPLDEPVSSSQEKNHLVEKKDHDSKPKLFFSSDDMSIASDFDPEVITAFRKSLELLPPTNPFHLKPLLDDDGGYDAKKSLQNGKGRKKLILFFTSLRGIRKTYEDCCHVRVILNGMGVRVDERDVSMHSGFKEELKLLLGDKFDGKLPKVFFGTKYIGDAESIRRLHEDGGLEKALEGCEMADDGDGDGCEACGNIRFVPCETCSGSCKIYCEADYDESEKEEEENDDGFQRCPDCNENGLVRCPICCD